MAHAIAHTMPRHEEEAPGGLSAAQGQWLRFAEMVGQRARTPYQHRQSLAWLMVQQVFNAQKHFISTVDINFYSSPPPPPISHVTLKYILTAQKQKHFNIHWR